jgi:hypothetical protein
MTKCLVKDRAFPLLQEKWQGYGWPAQNCSPSSPTRGQGSMQLPVTFLRMGLFHISLLGSLPETGRQEGWAWGSAFPTSYIPGQRDKSKVCCWGRYKTREHVFIWMCGSVDTRKWYTQKFLNVVSHAYNPNIWEAEAGRVWIWPCLRKRI